MAKKKTFEIETEDVDSEIVQAETTEKYVQGSREHFTRKFMMVFPPSMYEDVQLLAFIRGQTVSGMIMEFLNEAISINRESLEIAKTIKEKARNTNLESIKNN